MQHSRRRFLVLAAACGALSGCGFHLQGRLPLPPSLTRVTIDAPERQSDFVAALRAGLLNAGAQVVASPGPGVARIHVERDEILERVPTVSSRNIPTDYELTHLLRVSVDDADGKSLMASEELTLTRIYSFDERKLLAKEREKEQVLETLARDMSSLVLRRLTAL